MTALQQRLLSADTQLYLQIYNLYDIPHIPLLSRTISRLGDGVIYLLLGLALLWLDPVSGNDFFYASLTTFCFEIPLYLLLKSLIRRDRPCDSLQVRAAIKPADQFSFPSGHAAAAFAFASMLSSYYPSLAETAFATASLIGLSRVLLGVHYPTDILAGALLGMSSALLGSVLYLSL